MHLESVSKYVKIGSAKDLPTKLTSVSGYGCSFLNNALYDPLI